MAVRECVRGKVGPESFGLALGSERAFTPSAQATGSHPKPEVLLLVDEKRADGVIGKTVAGGPVRQSVAPKTPNTIATGSNPEIACGIIQQYRDRAAEGGSRTRVRAG